MRLFSVLLLLLINRDAAAHVSEQGLVLLLPTDIYIASGVLVVALTLVLLLVLPATYPQRLFSSVSFPFPLNKLSILQVLTSLFSLLLLCGLLYLGFTGTRDPLENLLPLTIWTVWWIALPIMHGIFGDIWRWLNPWSGLLVLLRHCGFSVPFSLPEKLGHWPGIIIFLLFTSFALADIAPDDPQRLAVLTAAYWCFTMLMMLCFGEEWRHRGECFSMLLSRFSLLSPLGMSGGSTGIGAPGWKLLFNPASVSVSASIFVLVLLGCGSFDGLNETFAWLAFIGVNPLEFPGRSAVVLETVLGLLTTNVLLIAIFFLCVAAGVCLANRNTSSDKVNFKTAFCALAVSVLPIAFAYHFAHFLTTFMINGQYAIAAVSDPLGNGADLLDLGAYYVTTGFMNTPDSVEAIWLTQAGMVVFGHVLSVLLAHAIAVQLFGNASRAIVSQAPLAAFMVGYTFIGLWLLAAPKGA